MLLPEAEEGRVAEEESRAQESSSEERSRRSTQSVMATERRWSKPPGMLDSSDNTPLIWSRVDCKVETKAAERTNDADTELLFLPEAAASEEKA